MNLNRRIVLVIDTIEKIIDTIEKILGQNKLFEKLKKRLKKLKKKIKKKYYCKVVKVIVYILLKIIIIVAIIVLAVGICMWSLKKNNNSVLELNNNKNEKNVVTKKDANEFLQIIEILDEIYNYK